VNDFAGNLRIPQHMLLGGMVWDCFFLKKRRIIEILARQVPRPQFSGH